MENQAINKTKLSFSGHESFQCRQLWLKKGYDFVEASKSFNNEFAVVELGVGKNMVNSIRYWLKAFNLINGKDEICPLAEHLLSNGGWDPFLEDDVSLWLLHYSLVKAGVASIYSMIFNELRIEKIEFNKNNFSAFVQRRAETENVSNINRRTVEDDFMVFLKMYNHSSSGNKNIEDSYAGLFTELNLVKPVIIGKEEYFYIENTERDEIPCELILYAILDHEKYGMSVNFQSLEQDHNSPGRVFALNRSGLESKLTEISQKFPYFTFTDHAGVKEVQFKKKPKALSVLNLYYNSKN